MGKAKTTRSGRDERQTPKHNAERRKETIALFKALKSRGRAHVVTAKRPRIGR